MYMHTDGKPPNLLVHDKPSHTNPTPSPFPSVGVKIAGRKPEGG